MTEEKCKIMGWRAVLLVVLALLPCCVGAQRSEYRLDFTLSERQFVEEVRIEYDEGRVFVPVVMGGRSYRFLLDTGASHAVVYDDTPIEGMTGAGTIASFDANNRKTAVELVRLPPLTIGGLTLTGCQATRQHRLRRDRRIDGVLGFDLVNKGLQMKIDVRAGLLTLTDRKKHFAGETGLEVKYTQNYHVPYLEVKPFERYTERALFDTGSRRLYAMNKQSFDRGVKDMADTTQVEGRSTGRHTMGFGGVEPRGEVVFLGLKSLQIAGYTLRDLHTVTTQGNSHVGAGLLAYGAVTFIPHRRTVRFQPYGEGLEATVGNRQVDKAIVNVGGQAVIGLLWKRGEAYAAGFREGDIIRQIDDRPVGSFADYLRFRPIIGHRHLFTVEGSDGERRQIRSTW